MTKQIIGNSKVISEIARIFADNMPPVSMFIGPSVGKKTTALKLIKSRLCQDKEASPCERCYSCLSFQGEINDNFHPNCFYYDSSLSLDSLKFVISQGSKASINGEAKYILLDDFDNLTDRLSNVLLKLLEEPPINLYFIIITKSAVLPTIMSRAQVFTFKDLNPDEMLAYLDGTSFSDEEKKILKFSSVGYVAIVEELNLFSELQNLRQALKSKDYQALIDIFLAQKNHFYEFLELLCYYAKERMLESTKPDHHYRWSHIIADLTYTLTNCRSRTFNQGYILQTLALKWYLLLCRFESLCHDKESILSLDKWRLSNWLLD